MRLNSVPQGDSHQSELVINHEYPLKETIFLEIRRFYTDFNELLPNYAVLLS